MTTLEINSKKQDNKSAKKKQKSFRYTTNIGTPLTPLRPRQTKQQEHELLSDWDHAS
ncbi:MAG: hypothetical protein KME30_31510 [Iphinoe sp. HA4291-MV1]|jgi:hypothetical protein|nr:hypothetical protein [Iphinoe sp. HA4291-MV1]